MMQSCFHWIATIKIIEESDEELDEEGESSGESPETSESEESSDKSDQHYSELLYNNTAINTI